MTQISITIDTPALAEAINHLAEAIKGSWQQDYAESLSTSAGTTEPAEPMASAPVIPAPTVQAPVATAPAQTQTAAPVNAASVQAATQAYSSAPASAPVKKEYTLDDLANAAAALIDGGKMPAIMQIIQKYGVPAINLLRQDQYEAFAADLRAIGGQI